MVLTTCLVRPYLFAPGVGAEGLVSKRLQVQIPTRIFHAIIFYVVNNINENIFYVVYLYASDQWTGVHVFATSSLQPH